MSALVKVTPLQVLYLISLPFTEASTCSCAVFCSGVALVAQQAKWRRSAQNQQPQRIV
jgi:hypothetical protein